MRSCNTKLKPTILKRTPWVRGELCILVFPRGLQHNTSWQGWSIHSQCGPEQWHGHTDHNLPALAPFIPRGNELLHTGKWLHAEERGALNSVTHTSQHAAFLLGEGILLCEDIVVWDTKNYSVTSVSCRINFVIWSQIWALFTLFMFAQIQRVIIWSCDVVRRCCECVSFMRELIFLSQYTQQSDESVSLQHCTSI